jgi:CHAT domain-containing protein
MTMVSYFCGQTTVTIFVVAPDGSLDVARIPLARDEIALAARQLQVAIDGDDARFPPLAPMNGQRPWGRDLSFLDRLIPLVGFVQHLDGCELASVSIDGPLRGLPLHALRCADDGRFLLERVGVVYSECVSMLLHVRTRRPGHTDQFGGRAFVGTVPALGERTAGLDDRDLLAQADWNVSGTADSIATTPAKVLQALRAERIVHLTCHGWFDRLEPLNSGLLLADGDSLPDLKSLPQFSWKRKQHLLTVRDIAAEDVRVELLTLRACGAARVAENPEPDERAGFAGALMLAGARSVVAAMWDVDRTSSRWLLGDFYKRLAAGPRVPLWRALADAQRNLLKRSPELCYRHLYHWAAFSLFGDWR